MTGRARKKNGSAGQRFLCLFCMLLSLCLLAGCTDPDARELKAGELFSIDGEVLTRGEAAVFLLSQQAIFAEGGSSLWTRTLGERPFGEVLNDALYAYLVNLFLMDNAAVRAGIRLSETEKAAVRKAAEAYEKALGREVAAAWEIDSAAISRAFTRYTLAQLYYQQVMHESVPEISDEEARAVELQLVFLPKEHGLEKAREVLEEIKKGKTVSEAVRDLSGVTTRKQTVVRGEYGGNIDTFAFSLRSGPWAPVVEHEDAYCLIQCLEANVARVTQVNKKKMEQEKREELLLSRLEELAGKVDYRIHPAEIKQLDVSSAAGVTDVNFYDYTDGLIVVR